MAFPGGRLDVGSIAKIYNGVELNVSPILQVVRVREVTLDNDGVMIRRFRYGLSDSKHTISALSTTQFSDGVPYSLYSVIQLISFSLKPTHRFDGASSFILVMLNSVLVNDSLTMVIGNPVDIGYNGVDESGNGSEAMGMGRQQRQNGAMGEATMVKVKDGSTLEGSKEMTADGIPIILVKDIDPYQHKWAIKVRVQNKGEIKKWNNEKGQGQLFSMTLLDSSGEIRATCFNDAVDKFHPVFLQNGIYLIYKCQVRFSNKKYTSIKHPYELHLDTRTLVHQADDSNKIPQFHFDFIEIDQIRDLKNNEMVDVCGIVVSFDENVTVHTKNGDVLSKAVEIADDTNRSIEVKVWGEKVLEFDEIFKNYGPNPLLFMKNVRVSEYSGKSLTLLYNTEVLVNLNINKAHKILKWFKDLNGNYQNVISLTSKLNFENGTGGVGTAIKSGMVFSSDEKTLSSILTEQLGLTSSRDYLVVPNVTLVWKFKENVMPWYIACSNKECKGLKASETNGEYFCTKCGSHTGTEPRWILNCIGYDFTGKEFMSAIGNVGDILMGISVKKALDIYNQNDLYGLYTIFEEAKYRTFRLKLAVRMDTSYTQEGRRRCTIINATPCNYIEDTKIMLEKLNKL